MKNLCILLLLFITKIIGEGAENKIVDGDKVEIEKFPYIVSVRYNDNHVCGGAILDEKTVITSAQCIFDLKGKPKLISIRAGSSEHATGLEIKSAKVVHPASYKREYHENDIGIIKLVSNLVWSENIKPIVLPDKDYILEDETYATFVGWGIDAINKTEVSTSLRKTDATVMSYMNCSMEYGSNMINLGMMICAKPEEQEFCRGDLGGPLVADNVLIGVASWVYDCDESTYPGVYTSVVEFLDWMQPFLEKHP